MSKRPKTKFIIGIDEVGWRVSRIIFIENLVSFCYSVIMKKAVHKSKVFEFPVVVEEGEKGWFFAYAPSLQGAYTQAKSLEGAFVNIKEVIELILEDKKMRKEALHRGRIVSITSLRIAV
jgi:predicted RNase H-like HicB family nuclease